MNTTPMGLSTQELIKQVAAYQERWSGDQRIHLYEPNEPGPWLIKCGAGQTGDPNVTSGSIRLEITTNTGSYLDTLLRALDTKQFYGQLFGELKRDAKSTAAGWVEYAGPLEAKPTEITPRDLSKDVEAYLKELNTKQA